MNKYFVTLSLIVIVNAVNTQNHVIDEADKLYKVGNYTKAIEAYKTQSDLKNVYHKIAQAYLALGNFDQALKYYELSVEANPDDAIIKFNYAKLLTRTKKYKDASELFEQLIYTDYRNPNYHYEQGVVLEKLRDSTAINRYKSAYDLDQTHQKTIFKIAKYYLIKREHNLCHKYIDKGLESYANNVELISLKAQNYYHQQYYTKAIPWFKKLLDLGEDSEFIHEKLSLCYGQNSDYEDAIKHRKLALKYSPFDANAMYVIGVYYDRLNDFENAESYLLSALKLKDVSLAEEYQKLGIVYNRQKKHQKAMEAFKKAIKEDPTNERSLFFLIRTKDEFYSDLDTKIKLYEDFKKKYPQSPYSSFADFRLEELKKEKFLEKD